MIGIDTAVSLVVYLIIAGIVFGLLFWLINYCASQFPGMEPFAGIARVILVILGVLVLIGVLLSFAGHPVFSGGGGRVGLLDSGRDMLYALAA